MNKKKLLSIIGGVAAGTIVLVGGLMIKEKSELKKESLYGVPDDGHYSYNIKFQQYQGTHRNAAQVRALIQLVKSVDEKALAEGDSDHRLSINYLENSTYIPIVELGENKSKINYSRMNLITSSRSYTVELKYGDTGLVNEITIIGE